MKQTQNDPSLSVSKNFRKKLSSGIVKKFDKALALTSRVARVSFNNKDQVSALSGATGSSISYANTGSKEPVKKDDLKATKVIKTTKAKNVAARSKLTNLSTNESIISK